MSRRALAFTAFTALLLAGNAMDTMESQLARVGWAAGAGLRRGKGLPSRPALLATSAGRRLPASTQRPLLLPRLLRRLLRVGVLTCRWVPGKE